MKFSYTFLKKILDGVPSRDKLIDGLNLHSFEAEDLGGDTLDISITPNRYSDAASHLGITREIAAVFKLKKALSGLKSYVKSPNNIPTGKKLVNVTIEDAKACPRYAARYFEIKSMRESPVWLKQILIACGLKPINVVVDIMNYTMLEVGQPLHAFDAGKLATSNKRQATGMKEIIIRQAKPNETITTLDGQNYSLKGKNLVIADARGPLAIAGIKGGLDSGIEGKTRAIIVEAANFDAVNIFQTSRALGLQTDASLRFSHGISPELVTLGMNRAAELLSKLVDAKLVDSADVYPKNQNQEIIGFSVSKCNAILGTSIPEKKIKELLVGLGFEILPKKKFGKKSGNDFLVKVPLIRTDVTLFEDLVEEVGRLYGYMKIQAKAPILSIIPGHDSDEVIFKELARTVLVGLGFSEVYNSTFSSKGEVEVQNPIVEDKKYLRTNLEDSIKDNLHSNLRFLEEVKIFEIGKVFALHGGKITEKWNLTFGVAHKKKESPIFEVKGAIDELLRRLGLIDFEFRQNDRGLCVYSGIENLGCVCMSFFSKEGESALASIDFELLMKLTEGEREYEPLPKFPSIMRDISILIGSEIQAGEVLEKIQSASPKYVQDVDMIDYFEDEKLGDNKKSLTFRIVFRSDSRTLTDAEVDREMKKINKVLQTELGADIR